MSLNLKYLIAARYVRSPKSHSVINIISGVSIVYANGMKHFPIDGEWLRQIPKSCTIIYRNNLKFGFLDLETGTDTGPIFDDFLQLKKGFPVSVRCNGKDGFIDSQGHFTEKKEKSWFKV